MNWEPDISEENKCHRKPHGAVLLLHLFSLANFFRGVMPAVTLKATRPGAPWGSGDKDQKGLSARSPKTLGGLEKMGVRGESKEAGQEAQERAVGWRHGWMDRRGEEGKGWIDRWMDRRTNAEGAGVQ